MKIQQINLINPLLKKKSLYISVAATLQVAVLLITTALVLMIVMDYRIIKLKNESTLHTIQITKAQLELDNTRSELLIVNKNNMLEENIRNAEAEARTLKKITDILNQANVGNAVGNSVYMQALARHISQGVWLTGFDISNAGTEISLQGRALEPDFILAYLSRLKREPALQGLQFSALAIHSLDAVSNKKNQVSPTGTPSYFEFTVQSVAVSVPVSVPSASTGLTRSHK
ncbi:MAG: Tfp pilus assembly protein PilN [Candidatus Paceibacteria bacterium]|jgi:Tfp pilus assembly protein PilN